MTERLVTYQTWRQYTVKTTDDTPTILASIHVPPDHAVAIDGMVFARRTDGVVAESLYARVRNAYNGFPAVPIPVPVIFGGTVTPLFADDPYWQVEWTEDYENVGLVVTGIDYAQISWLARLRVYTLGGV